MGIYSSYFILSSVPPSLDNNESPSQRMDYHHLNSNIVSLIMKSLPSIFFCCLAWGFPTSTTSSSLRPRTPQSPGAAGNITSYNSTASSNINSTNSNSSLILPPNTNCQSSMPLSTNINYPFILTANSNRTNTSISLIPSPLLGSTFHVGNGSADDPQNQGVFVLSPDGTLQGGLNDQVHNAGNCTLLSYGYADFAVQFPSCAVGNESANTDGTGVSVVGHKWIARNICLEDESVLILLPDFGGNTSVADHYFHSVPGSDPLLFHAQQNLYDHAYLVIEQAEMVDLDDPYELVPVEDILVE